MCIDACAGVRPASGNSSSQSENPGPPAVDSCLTYSAATRLGGSVGECTRKDGGTGHWYFTYVHSTMINGCPKEIDFKFYNQDINEVEQYSTPFNVQVCDYPAQAISIKE